ncbi:MAG: acylneuraminate cytidylyltransferase family protein [Candidatus Peribacteraceae bacterium]|jgi:CMP-N-acetylneuraminic acid synthetase|nr:acylneuraminate cytidylyltransferase family protein [Candidatus Peribacteraceae bacterium]HCI03629.1 acylneuraminate cytidylyltransferase [Candidatus Peribacteria bacterium]|tara:strand:+ start:2939 stop:3649 length:711 start_codon:yes stop_codon:yes gene_type:complete
MYKGVSTLGVITARGGSKGISGKNIKELLGKPLIAYTIEAAKNSKHLTRTIVSTEDPVIADIARNLCAEVPFIRPGNLAQDDSSSIDVLKHALEWFEENDSQTFDYVMILQPTSPLRQPKDIDKCIEKAVDTDADSVMSMVEIDDMAIKKLKKIKEDLIFPLLEDEDEGQQSARRTEGDPIYRRNTAIYLTKTKLIKEDKMFGNASRPYLMPKRRSVDINTPEDLEYAEYLMSKMK